MRQTVRRLLKLVGIWISVCSLLAGALPVRAADGLPGSPNFGFGGRLDLQGQQLLTAIDLAAGMNMRWIAIDLDWSRLWPLPTSPLDLTQISQVVKASEEHQLHILVSLTHAPAWALTPNGPDPSLTTNLVSTLVDQFPGKVLAVELFPGANTASGWGATPNASAYLNLFKAVQIALQAKPNPVTLLAGLSARAAVPQPGDQQDILFMDSLYQNGAAGVISVFGLRLPLITGEPMADPQTDSITTLRHYELIRKVMLSYRHRQGLLWITGFSIPAALAMPNSAAGLESQAAWITGAFRLMKSQLYIGAAFFAQVNPPILESSLTSLIFSNSKLHPACLQLADLFGNSWKNSYPPNTPGLAYLP